MLKRLNARGHRVIGYVLALLMSLVMLFAFMACDNSIESSTENSTTSSSTEDSSSDDSTSSSETSSSETSSGSDTTYTDTVTTGSILESLVTAAGVSTGSLSANGKFYTDYGSRDEERQAGKELSVEIAEEGDVLLKNADDALPLSSKEKKVTLFGMRSVDLIEAGGGSGGGTLDNGGIEHSTVESALEDAGFSVNSKTISLYDKHITLGTTENELPISYYTSSITSTYYAYNDAAVVTIGRIGAENVDCETNSVEDHEDEDEHYLQLDDNEKDLIHHVKEYFDKVIVLINSANIMQIPDLAEDKTDDNLGVDAIIWVGTTGNNCIDAVGSILNGSVNPSGHTVDLWSADFTQDPTFTNFGHDTQNKDDGGERMDAYYYDADGNKTNYTSVEYREGIYMGYRYYETVAYEMDQNGDDGEEWYDSRVLYPFGYGLSYTEFDWELEDYSASSAISAANETITMKVKVTNTGDVAGKEVVQMYYSAPYTYGGIEKASTNLATYAKTEILEPGESETLTLQIVAQDMASFDWNDANDNGFSGYELEAGTYTITANKDSHTPVLSFEKTVSSDILCETDTDTGNEITPVYVDEYTTVNDSLLNNSLSRVDLKDAPQPAAATVEDRTLTAEEIEYLDDQDTYKPYEDDEDDDWYKTADDIPEGWTQATEHESDYSDVELKLADMAGIDKTDTQWTTFMNQLTWDELTFLVSNGTGVDEMESIEKEADTSSDGPVQVSGGTLFAGAPIMAATYNVDLAYKMGRLVGNDCIYAGIADWHGPGMNIHRSPFSGRNFEYYSEDGVQGSFIAEAVVKGATSKGIITYVKHFFGNDQESYRADYGGVCTWATEQVLRENYVKCFEASIERGGSMGVMSSFNRLGFTVTGNSYATLTNLLRNQFGFTGAVVTDAWTKDYCSLDMMVRSGNDQVLGTGDDYTKNDLTDGEWSEDQNCVLVPASADDTTNSVVSYTHYYAVRIAAQNILYTRANSIANNNCMSSASIEVTIQKGVSDSAELTVSGSADVEVTVTSGSLPDGLSIENGAITGTTNVDEGDYTVSVDIVADGWVNTSGTLTVHVVSAMCYNGENIVSSTVTDTISVNESYYAYIDVPYYAYGSLIGNYKIVNRYYTDELGIFNCNEEKSAADIITYDPTEHEEDDGYEEYLYSFEATGLPDGVELVLVYDYVTGTTGSTYLACVGCALTGTPTTAGTYEISVTLTAPYQMCINNWIFTFFGSQFTYTETFTIVVQ